MILSLEFQILPDCFFHVTNNPLMNMQSMYLKHNIACFCVNVIANHHLYTSGLREVTPIHNTCSYYSWYLSVTEIYLLCNMLFGTCRWYQFSRKTKGNNNGLYSNGNWKSNKCLYIIQMIIWRLNNMFGFWMVLPFEYLTIVCL